jgi:hypothetical protein
MRHGGLPDVVADWFFSACSLFDAANSVAGFKTDCGICGAGDGESRSAKAAEGKITKVCNGQSGLLAGIFRRKVL